MGLVVRYMLCFECSVGEICRRKERGVMNTAKQKTDRSRIPTSLMLNFLTLCTLQAFATHHATICFLKYSITYAVLVQQFVVCPLVDGLQGVLDTVGHYRLPTVCF